MQLPDLSAFDAIILVLDIKAFLPEGITNLPTWLSSIPVELASRSLIAVDSCDALTVCKRSSPDKELETMISNRLRLGLDSFRSTDANQVTMQTACLAGCKRKCFFHIKEALPFHVLFGFQLQRYISKLPSVYSAVICSI